MNDICHKCKKGFKFWQSRWSTYTDREYDFHTKCCMSPSKYVAKFGIEKLEEYFKKITSNYNEAREPLE